VFKYYTFGSKANITFFENESVVLHAQFVFEKEKWEYQHDIKS